MGTDCIKAYNRTFSYTSPCELENKIREPGIVRYISRKHLIRSEGESALKSNLIKFAACIPVIGIIVYAILLNNMLEKRAISSHMKEEDKAIFGRVIIALSPLGPFLLILDIFSTIIIKPIFMLANSRKRTNF